MTQSELATGIKAAYDLADDLETFHKDLMVWVQASPMESLAKDTLLSNVRLLLVQVRNQTDACLSAYIQEFIDSRST